MNKFWIIFAHTYLDKIKSKTFIITTALFVLLVIGSVNIQNITSLFSDESKDQVAVIDSSEVLFPPLKAGVESADDSLELIAFDGTEEDVKTAVQNEKYESALTIALNNEGIPEANYYASDITNTGMQQTILDQLQQLKVGLAIEQAGFDEAMISSINAPVTFNTIALDEGAKTIEEMFQAQGVVYIMVFLMYIVVIMYGTMIATDVATEKSSRVMEILISSASPITHMFAKIIGIALVGLTQIGIIIAVAVSAVSSQKDELVGGVLDMFGFLDTPTSLIIYGVLFFLLGYLLYATLAAMLGSLVNRSEEANQAITPLIMLIAVAFLIAMFGLSSPESPLITVTSFIPFFAPMVMLLRIGMLDVAIWEIAISIGILIATIIILGLIGARVYKGGVLMYGSAKPLKNMMKAIQLSKKEK
ncbi:ABC transporter permease [Oceanobacillus chungangensis]|uniref:ABC-2 type transporter transmembrane domain-containing protein n=1 Tax=Oceanobacillus chungangensis TaxID=1229152 RepID=A0A3D8PUP0_9BACI|nr:ABC transporter permease [Oceanobacillus chungangensis]RDW19880.1 hypothetical protein CWR45_07405 [Oceanobacillus chungangensis]